MSQPRKVGVMIDNKDIEANLNYMSDVIRNANYKTLVAGEVKPNDEGDYLDENGENLLMSEEIVKSLLKDALDSYLVAALPGGKQHSPQEFNYYLMDSFPNVSNYIQANPEINTYVSALFAMTCSMMASTLSPALQDIVAHGQVLENIETFNIGPANSYYILIGEEADQELDNNPDHNLIKLSKEERAIRHKAELIEELGQEGYEKHIRKQQQERDNQAFTDYTKRVGEVLDEEIKSGGIRRYYSESMIDSETGKEIKLDPKKRWQFNPTAPLTLPELTGTDTFQEAFYPTIVATAEPLPRHPHIATESMSLITPADLGLSDESIATPS